MKTILQKFLSAVLFLILFSNFSNAQTTVTIGTGTASSGYPYATFWQDGRTNILITAAELTAGGAISGSTITQIGFDVTSVSSQIMNGFNIAMENTALSSLTAFVAPSTNVYSGTYTVPGTGWQMITLSSPFVWTGGNLLIQVCYDNTSYTSYSYVNSTAAAGMTWGMRTDGATGCTMGPGAAQANRPNTRLVFVAPAYCTPTYSNACTTDDYINNFATTNAVTNITNLATGCNGQLNNYIYYSGLTASENQGASFDISVQSGTWGQGFHIWVDWNNDLDFADAGEDVWNSGTSGTSFTGTITVPLTATTGVKRMRVRCAYNIVPTDPCALNAYGETEDYNLSVLLTPGCGNANSGALTMTPTWQNAPFNSGTIPFWSFTAVAGNFYDFSLCSYGSDTYLRLYDNLGVLVASNDDFGPFCNTSTDASMSWICQTSGTYIITASEFSCVSFASNGYMEYRETSRACADCTPVNYDMGNIGTTVYGYNVTDNCLVGGKWSGSFNGQGGATYHFDLCPDVPGAGTANFDIDIKITDGSCNILTGEDGTCTLQSWHPNDFTWTCPSSGTYYVILAPFPSYSTHDCSGNGSNTFTMNYYKEPLQLTCPPGAYVEGEPDCYTDYVDNYNGGCNSTPNVFSILPSNCSDVICGKAGIYTVGGSSTRDTDWYQFTTTDSTMVYVDGIAEFDLQLGLIDGNLGCPVGSFLTSASVLEGDSAHISYAVGPGTYWIWAGPDNWNGWACGSDYNLNFYTVKNPLTSPVALANPACGSTLLDSISSVGFDSYMWQGNTCGTSTANPANLQYPVTSTDTYFVRAYNSGTGCWSDTCTSVSVTILPLPAIPTITNSTICTGTTDTLFASGSTGLYNWWDAPTGGLLLGTDTSYVTPILTNTTTYYVSGSPVSFPDSITTMFASDNGSSGNMFDITLTNNITIDSLDVNIDAGPANMLVYYKTGTYLGFETNPTPWVLVGTETVTGLGLDIPTRVHIGGLNLLAGQTYGLYVTTDGGVGMNYTNGANTYSDANMSITCGAGGGYPFAVVNSPRTWNGTIYYSSGEPCESDRTPVTVTVTPIPSTAGTITGTTPVCINTAGVSYSVPAIPDATSYVWNYTGTGATINGSGTNITIDFSGTATSGDLTVLGSNVCGDGTSSLFSIVVDPCVGITENPNGVNVSIMPNPTTGKCVAQIVSEIATTYKLKVVDVIGKVIVEKDQNISAGTNKLEFDFSNQAPGIYYLHLTNDKTNITKKIIINK